jgi:hypothetical protein
MGRGAAAIVGLVLVVGAADASAQEAGVEPRFTLSLSAGPLHGGTLQEQPVRVERLGEEGVVTEAFDLDRRIQLRGGARILASATAALPAGWVGRLGASFGQGRLSRSYAGDEAWAEPALELDAAGSRDVQVVGVEVGLRYPIPLDHPFRPFIELGVVRESWRQSSGSEAVPGAEPLTGGATLYGAHIALGGDYPLTDRIAARVQLTSRFQRTPLAPMAPGTELARGDSLAIHSVESPARPFADAAVEMLSSVRFAVGLSYSPGRRAVRPADPEESDASPSAPSR